MTNLVRPVDPQRLRATVDRLVAFGTRHTLSSQTDPKRGIGAALRWSEAEFKRLGLTVVTPTTTVSGDRITTPVKITDVLAIQRGTERPNDVVIISAHLDSRVSDVMNAAADAPGANDDGSGTAAVMEAARVLSTRKFPATIVYAVLMGEEQGLYGGKLLADTATKQGWNVVATLNNDIVGNSCASDGVCDDKVVRIFSEGPRWQGHEELAGKLRSLGGENDSPSRNLSRFLDTLAERVPAIGLDVRQVWRSDRLGRSSDHLPMQEAGFPAVRVSVAVENYDAQHQDVRTEGGRKFGDTPDRMDFGYLAKVTRLNTAALAALASAPPPPAPTVEGAVAYDTTVRWAPVGPVRAYRLVKRRTDASRWDDGDLVVRTCERGPCTAPFEMILKGVRVDDWVFGVSAIGPNGFESPVASAVPGGEFRPLVPKPAK